MCSCCVFLLTDLQLPPSCEVEFSIPEYFSISMHNLLTSTGNYQTGDVIRLLAIFSSAVLKYQNVITKIKLSGLILTNALLVILEDDVQWLIPGSDQAPLIAREQTISNLIAIVSNFRQFLLLFTIVLEKNNVNNEI